ncbi:MAG: signal peptidase II [Actinobacteria bacterium]|nr:signal peptidase II [Actinomycetota bacterium]
MTMRRVALLATTVIAIVAADQYTKSFVRAAFDLGESRALIPGLLWLTRVKNTGAAFGMLKGQTWLLVGVAFAVLAAVAFVAVKIRPRGVFAQFALGMVTAGAIGNLIDRLSAGGVTDFFDLGWFPVFNVADISLDVGAVLLVWWLLFDKEHRHASESEVLTGQGEPPPSVTEVTEFEADE